MDAVIDSSSLISLAWAGQLTLLERMPLSLEVPKRVVEETVTVGLQQGHSDAAAIETAIARLPVVAAERGATTDEAVLHAAVAAGSLVANDVALGRRASNRGARWLRTADLVVLCVRTGNLDADAGRAAIKALRGAERITSELERSYLEELR